MQQGPVAKYQAVCRDLSLTPRERCQFVQNLFSDEALRFYNAHVVDRADNLGKVIRMMQDRLNSLSKQNNVKHELSSLTFDQFVSQSNGNCPLALRALAAHIEKDLPLCPDNWNKELHKMEFLRKALITEDWTRQILYKCNPDTKFHDLRSFLASILQIDEKARALSRNTTPSPSYDKGKKPQIMYQRYGKKNNKRDVT